MKETTVWQTFTDDMVDAFTNHIENTRRAALFKEMDAADQLTSILSAQVGSILYVIGKAHLHEDTIDAVHQMLEMGRKAMKEGRMPRARGG